MDNFIPVSVKLAYELEQSAPWVCVGNAKPIIVVGFSMLLLEKDSNILLRRLALKMLKSTRLLPPIWRIQQMGKEGSKRVLNSGISVNRECPKSDEWDGI